MSQRTKKQQLTTNKKAVVKLNRYVTKEALERAIEESYGNITLIAKRLKVHRSTVYDNIKKYELQDLIDSERERMVDFAESQLINNVKAGKEISIIFLLKTLGKNRGYIEKFEMPAPVNITFIDNSDKGIDTEVNTEIRPVSDFIE